jgi:uncharacterized protein (DUF2164 family)
VDVTKEGELLGYGTMYYHPQVAANVLSFFNMARRFKSITYNNQEKDAFVVQRDDNTVLEFCPSNEGLYYYNYNLSIKRSTQQTQSIMVIKTVDELRRNYTAKEIKQADLARRLYVTMVRPSKEDFRNMLEKGKLLKNPVTMRDYQIAENIYGKDLGVIKGKTVRVKPKQVVIDTTSTIHEKQNVVLAVDIMHLTSLNFLITVARNIRFITATFLPDRRKKTIVHAMRQVIGIYRGKGHQVTDVKFTETEERPIHTILADNEFAAIQAEMEEDGINVNTTAKEEHVPEVERQNRVIKERARAII